MILKIELPNDLDAGLNKLIEAGYFPSREEAVLKGAQLLLHRFEQTERAATDDREAHFVQNRAYFENRKRELQMQYGDAFVAIWEERVVDCDSDRVRLARRVYQKYGSVPIYIDQPSISPARFYVSSPVLG